VLHAEEAQHVLVQAVARIPKEAAEIGLQIKYSPRPSMNCVLASPSNSWCRRSSRALQSRARSQPALLVPASASAANTTAQRRYA
jgi:hypothetical protein